MSLRTIGVLNLSVLALLALLHHSALFFGLYWLYSWFDMPVHFLGGLWVGLAALWLLLRFAGDTVSRGRLAALILGSGIAVGAAWEVFEYNIGLAPISHQVYVVDTVLDLSMDLAGALAAFGIALYRRPRNPVLPL